MGKAPTVIIIARHGSRIDQADKQWHLTSPTPYDPPLTYGGWTQARALGARIGGILKAREEENEVLKTHSANGVTLEQIPRKRKHKIIIHSSPFVRCVQTSIAIGAGIGQFRGQAPTVAKHHVMHSGSPHIHALENSPGLSAIPEPAEDLLPVPPLSESSALSSRPDLAQPPTSAPVTSHQPKKSRIAELRLDAFLGEWLSPDYFENITPPPESVMMITSAKAELLRPGEPIEGSSLARSSTGNFPGGWSIDWSPGSSADESEEKTGLANMAALGHALHNRSRSSTLGSDSPGSYTRRHGPRMSANVTASALTNDVSYVPPTPTYAISSSDAIPAGYVAHAREACVDVCYQWDSMRPPQCWGDGGEYGEEWSSMHRRFRNGLSKMIEWYSKQGTAVKQAPEILTGAAEEKETDTVLVLVTHGAGCNALLGALTNQPVLLDVGMASLTMAVRKEGADWKDVAEKRRENEDSINTPSTTRKNGRRTSMDLGIAADYEIKYTASTDHLRAGSNPLSLSSGTSTVAPSPRIAPATSHHHHHQNYHHSLYRRSAASLSGDNFTIGEGVGTATLSAAAPFNAAIPSANLHRSMSGHSGLRVVKPGISNAAQHVSSGLWNSGIGSIPGLGRAYREIGGEGLEEMTESGTESDTLPNFTARRSKLNHNTAIATVVGIDGANETPWEFHSGSQLTKVAVDHDDKGPDVFIEQQRLDGEQTQDQQDLQQSHLGTHPRLNGNSSSIRKGNGHLNGNANSHDDETSNSNDASNAVSHPDQTSEAMTPSQLMRHLHTPTRSATQMGTGLWGGAAGINTYGIQRDSGRERERDTPKRRWTAVENAVG